MNQVRKKEFEDYFSRLPPEKEREYEKKIAKLAEQCTKNSDIRILYEMTKEESEYSYMAFQCLMTLHRRNKNFEKMKQLLDEHPEFQNNISYNHILVMYLVHSESFYDYDEVLNLAYKDALIFDQNSGYLHSFCDAFATICECCDTENKIRILKKWYGNALECINKAIQLDTDYAKFYCTKGRILSLYGKYAEAISLINQAISMENSDRPDYPLTIMNYQMHKLHVQSEQQKDELDKKIVMLESSLNSILEKLNIEMDQKQNTKDKNIFRIEVYNGSKSYAFVSYAHKDQDEVYKIIHNLQKNDARIWFDKGLELGKEWPEEIASHLIKSSLVLVMLSSNSIQSANVRREVNLALSEGKDLIVIRLDDVDLSPGMKLQFGIYQMIIKRQFDTEYFIKLLSESVNNRLNHISG